jgi:hypothetical protein
MTLPSQIKPHGCEEVYVKIDEMEKTFRPQQDVQQVNGAGD